MLLNDLDLRLCRINEKYKSLLSKESALYHMREVRSIFFTSRWAFGWWIFNFVIGGTTHPKSFTGFGDLMAICKNE